MENNMNCKNTDWSLIDDLIPKDEKYYSPNYKPNKKEYNKDEEGIYIQDMIIYFQDWNNNISSYYKIIADFFDFGTEHNEWKKFYKFKLESIHERKRKNDNNIKSWERKLWYYNRK